MAKIGTTFRLDKPSKANFPPLEVPAFNPLKTSGLARGSIIEVHGRRSCGKTAFALHVLGQATARGEICSVVDLYGSFPPFSAAVSGVRLPRLVWIRCGGNMEHALRAADLLLHAGGFGVVLLDLCEASAKMLNRIPLSYWHRFRRAVENTSTILLVCTNVLEAKSCAHMGLCLETKAPHWSGKHPFAYLRGLEIDARFRKAQGLVEALFIPTAV